MIVNDILKHKTFPDIATANADQTVADAAQLLSRWRIGALVVTDSDKRIKGIISERDIVRGLSRHGATTLEMKVGDLMTKDVLVCHRDDLVGSLMETMTLNRIRHLPVVEQDRLIGIISIGDVVKWRLEEVTLDVDQMREYVATAH